MLAQPKKSNVLSIFIILAFLLAQTGQAYASGIGEISGTLRDADNNPFTGVAVQVRALLLADQSEAASTTSDPATGAYTLSSLPLDTELVVVFSDEDPDTDGYPTTYYNGVSYFDWAEPILLTSGNPTRANVDVRLPLHSITFEHLTFNTRIGRTLNDVSIRKAIAYGTNRQQLLDEVWWFHGLYGHIQHSMVPPEVWFKASNSDPLLTVYGFDQSQAASLLTAAGWVDTDADGIRENGLDQELALEFATTTFPARVEAANLFKTQMAEIGILVNISTYPAVDFFNNTTSPLATGNFDIAGFAWILDTGDNLLEVYNDSSSLNHGGYSNPTLDAAFDAAKTAKVTGQIADFETNALQWQYIYSADLPSLPLFTREPLPSIGARANDDRLEGWNWSPGPDVTIRIDHDGDGTPEIERTAPVWSAPWNPGEYRIEYNFRGEYDIQPGDTITVTDGRITKELVVAEHHFTNIDQTADQAQGISDPNLPIDVWACDTVTCHNRHLTSDPTTGAWTADFSIPGTQDDEQTTIDIGPGTWIDSQQPDNDGDFTQYGIGIPNPNIQVRANEEVVEGWNWPVGNTVTIEIDRDDDGTPEISRDTIVEMVNWSADPYYRYGFWGEFDIQPGDVVEVSDGTITRTTTVSPLAFTDIDLDTDVVTGVASPGANINIWVCNDNDCNYNRHVSADASTGVWQADFGNVGTQPDEQTIADIRPGSWIDSSEDDGLGNSTMYGVTIPRPYVEANIQNNWAHAREWPNGTSVTLEVDDLSNGLGGVDYTVNATMGPAPWNPGDPNDIAADFDMSGLKLAVGDVLTVYGDIDGVRRTKTLTLSDLHTTGYDVAAETVSGQANPGADVEVCVNTPVNCISRWVSADATDGSWTADYSPDYNLNPGSDGWAAEYDADFDRTWYDWRIPRPHIEASPEDNWANAREWPLGTLLTLTIDDPSNGAGVDLTATATVIPAPWNPDDPNDILADFDLAGFDLKPGHLLKVTDSLATPTENAMTVANIGVDGFDFLAETIRGGGTPDQEVQVCVNIPAENRCISRYVIVDNTGHWQVDYSKPGQRGDEQETLDLNADHDGWMTESDALGNKTWAGWTAFPFVMALDRVNHSPSASATVQYKVTFSEPVTGVSLNDFKLVASGVTGASISGLSGSNSIYTVTVKTGTGSGTLRLNLVDDDSIRDAANNPLGGNGVGNGNFTGQTYQFNRTLVFHSSGTQDGWILETSEFSGLGGLVNSAATTFFLGDDAARKQYRGILSFTTSSIPDNAVITKVTLKFKQQGVVGGGNPVNTFLGFVADVKKGFFGSSATLQAADFQFVTGIKTIGPQKIIPASGWYSLNLTVAQASINKLTSVGGLTQIRLRFQLDDNNNALANYLSIYSGNAPLANRPQLIIEYYVP